MNTSKKCQNLIPFRCFSWIIGKRWKSRVNKPKNRKLSLPKKTEIILVSKRALPSSSISGRTHRSRLNRKWLKREGIPKKAYHEHQDEERHCKLEKLSTHGIIPVIFWRHWILQQNRDSGQRTDDGRRIRGRILGALWSQRTAAGPVRHRWRCSRPTRRPDGSGGVSTFRSAQCLTR